MRISHEYQCNVLKLPPMQGSRNEGSFVTVKLGPPPFLDLAPLSRYTKGNLINCLRILDNRECINSIRKSERRNLRKL